MKKILLGFLLGAAFLACRAEDVVTIDNSAQKAAFQARAEQVFGAAITRVTDANFRNLTQAMGAPVPPPLAPAAEESEEEPEPVETKRDILLGEEIPSGGYVKFRGTLTVTTTTEKTKETRLAGGTIDNTFTSIRLRITPEEAPAENLAISGTQTISGTIQAQIESTATTYKVAWRYRGDFQLDGRKIEYDVAVTYANGQNVSYSGTVNGVETQASLSMGKPELPSNALAGACIYAGGQSCTEFYGYSYSPWSDDTCNDLETPAEKCSPANFIATCTWDKGTSKERVEYTKEQDQFIGCTIEGGIYELL